MVPLPGPQRVDLRERRTARSITSPFEGGSTPPLPSLKGEGVYGWTLSSVHPETAFPLFGPGSELMKSPEKSAGSHPHPNPRPQGGGNFWMGTIKRPSRNSGPCPPPGASEAMGRDQVPNQSLTTLSPAFPQGGGRLWIKTVWATEPRHKVLPPQPRGHE